MAFGEWWKLMAHAFAYLTVRLFSECEEFAN
ncbi:hypothetical protein X762_04795 [Mesorhizobium sp. LSHC426A00]|nr:hypothetical protein X762_04795 [Mesorhizobium sp. LSHC426A00]